MQPKAKRTREQLLEELKAKRLRGDLQSGGRLQQENEHSRFKPIGSQEEPPKKRQKKLKTERPSQSTPKKTHQVLNSVIPAQDEAEPPREAPEDESLDIF